MDLVSQYLVDATRNSLTWCLCCPGAFINFNDDGGGGNLVETSLVYNSCRESQVSHVGLNTVPLFS
jgi:hypothetical protein